jgi:hypothetical protein
MIWTVKRYWVTVHEVLDQIMSALVLATLHKTECPGTDRDRVIRNNPVNHALTHHR